MIKRLWLFKYNLGGEACVGDGSMHGDGKRCANGKMKAMLVVGDASVGLLMVCLISSRAREVATARSSGNKIVINCDLYPDLQDENSKVPVLAGYPELWIDNVGPPKFMGLIGYSISTR
ncbi:hypothetical protein ZIOFF_050807 [Zingiber officinale]|uniref:Uncharacterized protein n=1 Tax=Zingiber officinale TaxID=94328 RepID=A0A8J5FLQ0_ZINOF|nr:hypothetical protein ZIOFF_050807 [Zingiber officinale]